MVPNSSVSIEALVLANHVELAEGRLHISGAGWNILRRPAPQGGGTTISHLGIAVFIAVPWHQTNVKHKLIIELLDEDGKAITNIPPLPFNVGRPAELRPGSIQYPNVGLSMDIALPHPGDYEFVARIEGVEGTERRRAFHVQDFPPMGLVA